MLSINLNTRATDCTLFQRVCVLHHHTVFHQPAGCIRLHDSAISLKFRALINNVHAGIAQALEKTKRATKEALRLQ